MRSISFFVAIFSVLFSVTVNAYNTSNMHQPVKFTCNSPYMVLATYTDLEGNDFIMCFTNRSDRALWYIQELKGSYKALGYALKHGNELIGNVVPIELPFRGSDMHASPVKVSFNLDMINFKVVVKPLNGIGMPINWKLAPSGTEPGTLIIPRTCGPFLKPVHDPSALAPLNGAEHYSTGCMLPGEHTGEDAFISWGSYKKDLHNPPAPFYRGEMSKYFAVGFIGHDHGTVIDICDPNNPDAQRCEFNLLNGHRRKIFRESDSNKYDHALY